MGFRIIDITSAETVKVRGSPAFLQVNTEQDFDMPDNEVGIILGKHSFHEKGILFGGGIVNPGWQGRLTIEMQVYGDVDIKKGQKIAHVLILQDTDLSPGVVSQQQLKLNTGKQQIKRKTS